VELIDPTGIEKKISVPLDFNLAQNYPNPFNPSTEIRYQLPERSTVVLTIYNALGEKVKTLAKAQDQPAGSFTLRWDGKNDLGSAVSSGIYFYRLEADSYHFIRKMILIR